MNQAASSRIIPAMVRAHIFVLTYLCMAGQLLSGQTETSNTQRPLLIETLQNLHGEMLRVAVQHRRNDKIAPAARTGLMSVEWLINAAHQWTPKDELEGQGMREAMARMLEALRQARLRGKSQEKLIAEINEDLLLKTEYCRKNGLAATQQVKVATKRKGVAEVKGLEVLYIEEFLDGDPEAKPHQFREFSSPAMDDLVPGIYVFWSRDPANKGRNGAPKDARVGVGQPSNAIEVLAP